MRRASLLGVDLSLVFLGSALALVLRENFDPSSERLLAFLPHLALTLAVAVVVIPLFGLNRSVWRFTSLRDYLFILGASVVIVLGAVMGSFSLNRLEGVPRSVPLLQAILILLLLVGARVYMRLRHAARRAPVAQFASVDSADGLDHPATLIVGINRLTELYLQSAQELSPGAVRIAGLVGSNERHTGRLMHRHPVLGVPEDLQDILNTLQNHGVFVDRIVVTAKEDSLSPKARAVLEDIADRSDIRVAFLAQSLGFDAGSSIKPEVGSRGEPPLGRARVDEMLAIDPAEQARLKARRYWTVKRLVDLVGAACLILLLAPVMGIAAVLVLMDVGAPMLFWQQRPGLGGRPFKLYKLRTMGPAHDALGQVIPDDERVSAIGRFLRRTRMDELPQLFHILFGQMSFVGPRPLLPVDQPVGAAARLLVRPGLTGWAQVKGGRLISAADKAALDLWYVRHASLALDLVILVRTVGMVLFGERTQAEAIRKAWEEIKQAHIPSEAPLSSAPVLSLAKHRSESRRAG
jgi:lipopolysaccharide/colanic/teichoic acid biosynthesis glycosyltransferase